LGLGKLGIDLQRLAEHTLGLIKASRRPRSQKMTPFQHESVGLGIHRASDLGRTELDLKLLRNEPRNLILHREDVLQVARERIGPYMETVRRLDELRGDADLVAGLAHAALDDVGHA